MGLPSLQPHDHASALLDPTVLDGLAEIMAPADLRALLADMIADVEQRLHRMPHHRALRKVQQDAHDLKSMGGNFGLPELSAAAAAVERDARRGADDAVASGLPGLIETGRASVEILAKKYAVKTGGTA